MAHPILNLWRKTQSLPLGNFIFNKAVHFKIPYTGSVKPKVVNLEPGHAVVQMADRRAVRNHLQSIHAIAQINLAEFCTGLAVTTNMPQDGRAIITGLAIEYTKKARGRLTAECRFELPKDYADQTTVIVHTEVRDPSGDVVSKAQATWLLGYARK